MGNFNRVCRHLSGDSILNFMALFLFMLGTPLLAHAQDSNSILEELQTGWAVANYELDENERIHAFEGLIEQGDANLSVNPNNADIQTWTGIIKSSLAGAKGGLGALSLAKAAKVNLERAIEINPLALSGSAYTSLGVLYHNVPGWPFGFGDKKTAKTLLLKGLEINPAGIDSNYFYANFLVEQKNYNEAKTYYQKALAAGPRDGRELADKGRRKEISAALDELVNK